MTIGVIASMGSAGASNIAVSLDTSTSLSRGANLDSIANGKTFLVGFTIRTTESSNAVHIMYGQRSSPTVSYFEVFMDTIGRVNITGRNSSGQDRLNIVSAFSSLNDGDYHTVLASINVADLSASQIYVDDADDAFASSFTDETMVFNSCADWLINDNGSGSAERAIDLFNPFLALNETLDLDTASNRRFYVNADGSPVDDLGPDGTGTGLPTPDMFNSGRLGAWPTNKGTGGAFTVAGALTEASASPLD